MIDGNKSTGAPREQFSRLGFILATAGSAIGLGNIWRFPYMTGTNGGGAFLVVFVICLLVVGTSLLLVEFAIGRHGQSNAIDSYRKINKHAKWIGYLGFFSAFIFLSYYSVVGGWTIYYTFQSATGLASLSPDAMGGFFGNFIGDPVLPLLFHLIFMALTMFIIAKGIRNGIDKYSKILMPVLLGMILLVVVRSVTLPGAMEGIRWYLTPDFSAITINTWIAAMGQVFFSLSIGMSGMVTYASYLSKTDRLPSTAFVVSMADLTIALLAGFMIFPAIFALNLEPGYGVGLIFISLPALFTQMPLGSLFGTIFFALLIIASLTSAISILEMPVTYIIERFKYSRLKSTMIVGGISYVMGIAVSFSFGIWSDFLVFGMNIFELFDGFGSNISLPLGGLAAAITVGWLWKKKSAVDEVTNNGTHSLSVATSWFNLVKYVVPVVIILIFLSSIGLLTVQ